MVKQLIVSGRVQGVGFRESMIDAARRLNVSGWVRNRRDGSVEAVLAGDAPAVEALVAWTRRGPPAARVDEVKIGDAEGEFKTFELRPTA